MAAAPGVRLSLQPNLVGLRPHPFLVITSEKE